MCRIHKIMAVIGATGLGLLLTFHASNSLGAKKIGPVATLNVTYVFRTVACNQLSIPEIKAWDGSEFNLPERRPQLPAAYSIEYQRAMVSDTSADITDRLVHEDLSHRTLRPAPLTI